MRARASDVELDHRGLLALVADNYPLVARGLLRPLLDLFSVTREACGGDIDKYLIMLVVGSRTLEHADFSALSHAQLMSGAVAVLPSLGTNVRSIADSIGAPRETIRRKVRDLIEAGWIVRQGKSLQITTRAYQDLSGARDAVEQLAVTNYEVIAGLLRSQAAPAPAEGS